MTDTVVNPLGIELISNLVQPAHRALAAEAGIRAVHMIAGSGSYQRTPATVIGLENAKFDTQMLLLQLGMKNQQHQTVYRVELRDATVTGQGTLVTRNGRLIRESALEFLAHDRVPDGFARQPDGNLHLAAPHARHITAPALLLKRPWWRNYGHWLVDAAALLALASGFRMPEGWQIVVGANETPAMRAIVEETLAVLAPGIPVLEHPDNETWSFSTLHYVTPVHVPPLFKLPQALACLRAILLHTRSEDAERRRIFVARRPSAPRRLENEDEVLGAVLSRGFTIVYPEDLSLRKQAQLFHSAEIVVGIKGAALANLIFSACPCSVLVLSPADFPDPFFWDLAGQLGFSYCELFGPLSSTGPSPSRNPFRIDLADLTRGLDFVLSESH